MPEFQARINQVVHKLIVANAIIAKPAKPRARIHHKRQQIPASRIENFFAGELSRVGLIDTGHHLSHAREGFFPRRNNRKPRGRRWGRAGIHR